MRTICVPRGEGTFGWFALAENLNKVLIGDLNIQQVARQRVQLAGRDAFTFEKLGPWFIKVEAKEQGTRWESLGGKL